MDKPNLTGDRGKPAPVNDCDHEDDITDAAGSIKARQKSLLRVKRRVRRTSSTDSEEGPSPQKRLSSLKPIYHNETNGQLKEPDVKMEVVSTRTEKKGLKLLTSSSDHVAVPIVYVTPPCSTTKEEPIGVSRPDSTELEEHVSLRPMAGANNKIIYGKTSPIIARRGPLSKLTPPDSERKENTLSVTSPGSARKETIERSPELIALRREEINFNVFLTATRKLDFSQPTTPAQPPSDDAGGGSSEHEKQAHVPLPRDPTAVAAASGSMVHRPVFQADHNWLFTPENAGSTSCGMDERQDVTSSSISSTPEELATMCQNMNMSALGGSNSKEDDVDDVFGLPPDVDSGGDAACTSHVHCPPTPGPSMWSEADAEVRRLVNGEESMRYALPEENDEESMLYGLPKEDEVDMAGLNLEEFKRKYNIRSPPPPTRIVPVSWLPGGTESVHSALTDGAAERSDISYASDDNLSTPIRYFGDNERPNEKPFLDVAEHETNIESDHNEPGPSHDDVVVAADSPDDPSQSFYERDDTNNRRTRKVSMNDKVEDALGKSP